MVFQEHFEVFLELLSTIVMDLSAVFLVAILPLIFLSKTIRTSIMVTHIMTCLIIPYNGLVDTAFQVLVRVDVYKSGRGPSTLPAIVAYESLICSTLFMMAPMFPYIHFLIISFLVRHRVAMQARRYVSDVVVSICIMAGVIIGLHVVYLILFINPEQRFTPWSEYSIVEDGVANYYVNSVRVWLRLIIICVWAMSMIMAQFARYSVSQMHIAFMFISFAYLVTLVAAPDVVTNTPWIRYTRGVVVAFVPLVILWYLLALPVVTWPTTLGPVLRSPIGVEAFIRFLDTEYAGENLRFVLALRRLQLLARDPIAAANLLDRIMVTYVRQTATDAVNLPDPIVRAITEYHAEFTKQCETDPSAVVSMAVFRPAVMECSHMMEDSFTRFKRSNMYSTMVRDMQQHQQTVAEASVLKAIARSVLSLANQTATADHIDLAAVADVYEAAMSGIVGTSVMPDAIHDVAFVFE